MTRHRMMRSSTQASVSPKKGGNHASVKDPVEKAFMASLQNAEAYIRLQKEVCELIEGGGVGGIGELLTNAEHFDNLLQPFCKACWEETERTFLKNQDSGVYAAAREEAQLLKKQLNECNLACMKQVTDLKSGAHNQEPLGEETVTFYEPLQHLEPEIRELVLRITADKVSQIENGTAPNALIGEICKAVARGPKKLLGAGADGSPNERDMDLLDEVEELKDRLEAQVEKATKSEARAQEIQERLAQAKRESVQLQLEAERLQEEAAQQSTKLEEAREGLSQASMSLAAAEAQLVEAAGVEAELREAQATSRARTKELELQLQMEQEANASMQMEIEKGKEAMARADALEEELREAKAGAAEARRLMEELEVMHRELQTKALKLEEEAADLRRQLESLRSSQLDCATQSSAGGTEIENLEAENRRLKVCVEELRAKLGDLMTECKKSGVSSEQMDVIVDKCGLQVLRKAKSVFENLYQDAMRRVERLEKLREKYRQEHAKSLGLARHPEALALGSLSLGRNAEAAPNQQARQGVEPWPPCSPGNSSSQNQPRQGLGVLEELHLSDVRWLLPEVPIVARPGHERLGYQPDCPLVQRREFKDGGQVEPIVMQLSPTGILQRPADIESWPLAIGAREVPLEFAEGEPARPDIPPPPAPGVPSSPLEGRALAVAQLAQQLSAEAGGEFARRLGASRSLPSLGLPSPSGGRKTNGRGGGAGGAFHPHRGGLSNLMCGRQRGVDDSGLNMCLR